jgi:DMSO/TMAO reductase YedYZ molybdopterin-dependent catalytic subunit/type III secretory pathway component EscS
MAIDVHEEKDRSPRERAIEPRTEKVLSALTGIVSALVTLAVAEVASLFLGGNGSPLLAVGSFVIDVVPEGVKSGVIALFGTADKIVLSIVLGLIVAVLAALAGMLQYRRPPFGILVLGVVAAIALAAVLTRADATPVNALPTLAGALVGSVMLRRLAVRLRAWSGPLSRAEVLDENPRGLERRRFLQLVIVAGVASAVVGAGARIANAGTRAASAARAALRLPAAASAAPILPPDAVLDIDGISPFIVPAKDFYRIDTALQVPSIDPAEWELRIVGMVENEVTISYDELAALPQKERYMTLSCVSNTVGGSLVGNALWLGYPIRELLARAKPLPGADMVLSRSIDGFTAGTPIEVLQDESTDALLAIGMNGEPLPLEHGFPVRMVVPGLYGYVSATKWVVELDVTTFAADEGYWTPRGWDAKGPAKVASRIDTPRNRVSAGTVPIAGVAWAPHTGIAKVEVSIDGGAWHSAELARVVTVDSWLQWSFAWDAAPGSHDIRVRATDTNGYTQTADEAPPAPNGSTGWHEVSVRVA